MPLRLALMVALALGLAGCGGMTTPAPYPALVPLDQLLVVPRPLRRPDPGLLARGAALRKRAAALMAN